jgi:hypothetical protein
VHRKWLASFLGSSDRELVNIVLAQFELDRVMALHQRKQLLQYELEVDDPVMRLGAEEAQWGLKEWLRRPIIEKLEFEEANFRASFIADEKYGKISFLHYPCLSFQNDKFALLLKSYHRQSS